MAIQDDVHHESDKVTRVPPALGLSVTFTIRATAPVRVADLGGWTDTWFARSGRVCSIAVEPGAIVEIRADDAPGPISLHVGLTGERYSFAAGSGPGRHPLLEAAIATLAPPGMATITVAADVPAGSGTGTSAAVCVALLAALAATAGVNLGPAELASMAHNVETSLGWQSGVQDQWAAAFGGANELLVDYPNVRRRAVEIGPMIASELQQRLITVYLGEPHSSSALHEEVIAAIAQSHPHHVFHRLCAAAEDGSRALALGDLPRFGAAMIENHEAVRQLHPGLIGARAEAAIDHARQHGALGWNLNGAGGDGGSITFLGPPSRQDVEAMRQALNDLEHLSVLDLSYCPHGVTTATTTTGSTPAVYD